MIGFMEPLRPFLSEIWYLLLGLILLVYAITDGFDLGVGMLSLLTRDEERREAMMAAITPFWHANQTWLVIVGGLLFGAFPKVYGGVLTALYLPLVLLLAGLIARGLAFEFRGVAAKKAPWSLVFGVGSLVAALAQGLALGAILTGLRLRGGVYLGDPWEWFHPFCFLSALGLVFNYCLLGAAFLILKTTGPLRDESYRWAHAAAWLTVASAVAVWIWAASALSRPIWGWPSLSALYRFSSFSIFALCAFVLLLWGLRRREERSPFTWSVVMVCFAGADLMAGLYPYVIPPSLTVASAAAPANTLEFMLLAIGTILPILFLYNVYQYKVFAERRDDDPTY